VYLRIFGGASVDGPSGPIGGRAAQRHRLGLMALLALHPRLTREKVVAYLWPSATESRGRRLLSDSIYRIHQELGCEVVIASGEDLRLDAGCLPCDAVDFQAAVKAGDFERAVDLYAGPLLDGFFVPDAGEFERWATTIRDELAAEHARALEALAQRAEEAGDTPGAIRWLRRAAAADPVSSRVTLRLMEALARRGERGAAIRQAHVHARFLEEELGATPDPAIEALLDRIRRDPEPAMPPAPPEVRRPHIASQAIAPESIAPPDVALESISPVPARPSRGAPGDPEIRGADPARKPWRMVAGVLATVLILVAGAAYFGRPEPAAVRGGVRDIVVLPFVDLGPAGEHDYFADGITEELIAVLSRVEGLRVVGRTSAFAFRDQALGARQIGEVLGVGAILEGSVRMFDDRLRLTARLVDVETGYQLWGETYDRRMEDVLRIQDEIGRSIAATLQRRLVQESPSPGSIPQVDPDAYNLYLQGRFFWHRRTGADLRRAAHVLEAAVSRAPDYAQAHVGLGDAYAVLGFYDFLPPSEAFPRAREAALRALELDPSLAAAHATLGYVALYHEWDWERAEDEFRRAIRLAPSYSTAHQWYANFLTARGRFPEAESAMLRAQELDPLSLIANAALGWVHYYAGDYDRSIAQCLRTLELDSRFGLAYLWMGQALERTGRLDEGIAAIERAVELDDGSALSRAALARILALRGSPDQTRAILADLERTDTAYVPSYEIARVHEALGDTERALDWLERAFHERSHSMVFLEVDPALAALRPHPRFRSLTARVGLP
jgi:TolB-like protein/DNA-binding SARP family transcriptional activator/Flp pilus assembly protein TadD